MIPSAKDALCSPQQEPGPRHGATTVFRPQLGIWLAYGFLCLAGCFLVFVSFYEVHPLWHRLVAIAPVAMLLVSLVDLRVARVEIDDRAVHIRGILEKGSFTYSEVDKPPEDYAQSLGRPFLGQRLSSGRIVRFPVWLAAKQRRQIARRIQMHLERSAA